MRSYQLAGGTVPEGTVPDSWLIERFRTVNLFEWRPAVWRAEEARNAASIVKHREIAPNGDLVILLGRRVAAAMGFAEKDWFETWTHGSVRFWLCLHPSGMSRLMNDPGNQLRVGQTLRTALAASGRGDT